MDEFAIGPSTPANKGSPFLGAGVHACGAAVMHSLQVLAVFFVPRQLVNPFVVHARTYKLRSSTAFDMYAVWAHGTRQKHLLLRTSQMAWENASVMGILPRWY